MRVAINARYKLQRVTGVQRYANEVVDRLMSQKIDGIKYELFKPESTKKIHQHIWEQIYLPKQARDFDVIFNPINTASLLSSNNVVTIHDIAFYEVPQFFSKKFRAYYNFLIPRLANKAVKIITVSNYSKSRLIELWGISESKIVVTYNGVDNSIMKNAHLINENEIRVKFNLPERFVLFVGSIQGRKNFEVLIKALNILKDSNINLVVVGEKSSNFSKSNSDKLITSSDNIIFTGYVNDEDLLSIYKAATIFIYPSLYEGFGLPVLESMAVGTPVIASNVTSLPEVVGDAGVLFNPNDPMELAGKIRELFYNDNLLEHYKKIGEIRAKLFSWERTSADTFSVLSKIESGS